MELLVWVIAGFAFGAVSAYVAPEDKRGPAFFLGLLFGPFGLIVSIIMGKQ